MIERLYVSQPISSNMYLNSGDGVYFPKESNTNYLQEKKFIIANDSQTLSKTRYSELYNKVNINLPNIITWTPATILSQIPRGYNVYVRNIEYAFDKFWTFGTGAATKDGNIHHVLNSTNAINWTAVSLPVGSGEGTGIFIYDKLFAKLGGSGPDPIRFTTNGINWTTISLSGTSYEIGAYNAGRYIINNNSSTNGINWTAMSLISPLSMCTFNNVVYSFSNNSISYSTNSINWTAQTYYIDKDIKQFKIIGSGVLNNIIIAVSETGVIFTSTDSINWKFKTKTYYDSEATRKRSIIQNNKCYIYSQDLLKRESLIYSEDAENFYTILKDSIPDNFYIRYSNVGIIVNTNNLIWATSNEGNSFGGVVTYSMHKYSNLYNYTTSSDFVLNYSSSQDEDIDLYIKHE